MPAAPVPTNEQQRLQALHELRLLDTPPEERFDRIVRFASEQLDVPIALISLIDSDRRWFKSKVGLDIVETRRDVSFCAHAILQPELFVVEDARLDPRFADNPLVTGNHRVRFYAGAAISGKGGERIGTLCVIDRVPRKLGVVERAVLESLRSLVNETVSGELDEG